MSDIIMQVLELFGYDPTISITNLSQLIPVIITVSLGTAFVGFIFRFLGGFTNRFLGSRW